MDLTYAVDLDDTPPHKRQRVEDLGHGARSEFESTSSSSSTSGPSSTSGMVAQIAPPRKYLLIHCIVGMCAI